MAINELNELKINVHLNPEVKIVGKVNSTQPIIAHVASGARGKSAYQIWLDQGYIGTEEDFLIWLQRKTYIHDQLIASNEWVINHNTSDFPSVTITDTTGEVIIAEVRYMTDQQVIINFSEPIAGKAFLN